MHEKPGGIIPDWVAWVLAAALTASLLAWFVFYALAPAR
jgi:hypothetical protein